MGFGPRDDLALEVISMVYVKPDGQRILLPPQKIYETIDGALLTLFQNLGLDELHDDLEGMANRMTNSIVQEIGMFWIAPEHGKEDLE
jgi:hypothetical protein